MGVAETFLQPDDRFAIAGEAEMPRLNDTGMDRANWNLVQGLAFDRQERVGRCQSLFLRPAAVVEPGARVGQALGFQAEQVADGALQPDRGRVVGAHRRIALGGTCEANYRDLSRVKHSHQHAARLAPQTEQRQAAVGQPIHGSLPGF